MSEDKFIINPEDDTQFAIAALERIFFLCKLASLFSKLRYHIVLLKIVILVDDILKQNGKVYF